MTQNDKLQIVEDLELFINQKGSANKVVADMPGVSTATVSNMRNHKWEDIADEMWQKVKSYVGGNSNEWLYCPDTRNAIEMLRIYSDAQRFRECYGIIGKSGHGKTGSAKYYEQNNNNVINIFCTSYMDERGFLSEILSKLGKETAGLTTTKLMAKIVLEVKAKGNIVFVLNEYDKLMDKVLYLFISLYNEVEDDCGMVISATHYLKKKIDRGVVCDKMGYREILSRVGGKLFEIEDNDLDDTSKICKLNGINDFDVIKKIYHESKGDGRRIKRLVNINKRFNAV